MTSPVGLKPRLCYFRGGHLGFSRQPGGLRPLVAKCNPTLHERFVGRNKQGKLHRLIVCIDAHWFCKDWLMVQSCTFLQTMMERRSAELSKNTSEASINWRLNESNRGWGAKNRFRLNVNYVLINKERPDVLQQQNESAALKDSQVKVCWK